MTLNLILLPRSAAQDGTPLQPTSGWQTHAAPPWRVTGRPQLSPTYSTLRVMGSREEGGGWHEVDLKRARVDGSRHPGHNSSGASRRRVQPRQQGQEALRDLFQPQCRLSIMNAGPSSPPHLGGIVTLTAVPIWAFRETCVFGRQHSIRVLACPWVPVTGRVWCCYAGGAGSRGFRA